MTATQVRETTIGESNFYCLPMMSIAAHTKTED